MCIISGPFHFSSSSLSIHITQMTRTQTFHPTRRAQRIFTRADNPRHRNSDTPTPTPFLANETLFPTSLQPPASNPDGPRARTAILTPPPTHLLSTQLQNTTFTLFPLCKHLPITTHNFVPRHKGHQRQESSFLASLTARPWSLRKKREKSG
jgi:hypothetical protein